VADGRDFFDFRWTGVVVSSISESTSGVTTAELFTRRPLDLDREVGDFRRFELLDLSGGVVARGTLSTGTGGSPTSFSILAGICLEMRWTRRIGIGTGALRGSAGSSISSAGGKGRRTGRSGGGTAQKLARTVKQ
jgi:hypothetical protein